MIKKKKTSKQGDRQAPKVSYNYKPEGMTLEQWQIVLRQQAAMKEAFVISEDMATDGPGYYKERSHYTSLYRTRKAWPTS